MWHHVMERLEVRLPCDAVHLLGLFEWHHALLLHFTELKLHLLRLDGDISRGVMRPLLGTVKQGNNPVLGLVDLTKAAKCALGGDTRRCTREGSLLPAPSSCWGSTSFVRVKGANDSFYGFWACRGRRDIDQGLCHFDGNEKIGKTPTFIYGTRY